MDYDQSRLYELIWKRAIASQMSDAKLERTQLKIAASTHPENFVAKGEVITFDGFLKVYLEGVDEESDEQNDLLPACLLYTSPSPRDRTRSRMPSSA